MSRFQRLRATADPTRRLTASPRRGSPSSYLRRIKRSKEGLRSRFPFRRTRSNSAALRNRSHVRPSDTSLLLISSGGKPLPSLGATTRENGASHMRSGTAAESMFAKAPGIVRLKSTFLGHDNLPLSTIWAGLQPVCGLEDKTKILASRWATCQAELDGPLGGRRHIQEIGTRANRRQAGGAPPLFVSPSPCMVGYWPT